MSKYVCTICGYVYDEEEGYPDGGISPNTPWSEIPETYSCPLCGALKEDFRKQDDVNDSISNKENIDLPIELPKNSDYSAVELSAIFSNLSKGAEKQYDKELSDLYSQLSSYYNQSHIDDTNLDFKAMRSLIDSDLTSNFNIVNSVANKYHDRGALRALKWSEQVTRMINSHLKKLSSGSTSFLKDSNLYVCDICGYIHIGKEKPEICPVCKVPNIKLTMIKRGA